jgi:hypothetical protein
MLSGKRSDARTRGPSVFIRPLLSDFRSACASSRRFWGSGQSLVQRMRHVIGVSSFGRDFRFESDARTVAAATTTPKALPAHRRAGSATSVGKLVLFCGDTSFAILLLKSRNVTGRAFANNADDILRRARTSVPARFALPPAD